MLIESEWYGLSTPFKAQIDENIYKFKSYSIKKDCFLIFDMNQNSYIKTTRKDLSRYEVLLFGEGYNELLYDFIQYCSNSITIEDSVLRLLVLIAGGRATKQYIQKGRSVSPFHTAVVLFAFLSVLDREISFLLAKNEQLQELSQISIWIQERILYLKAIFEIRYGTIDPKVVTNATLLINHLLPLAEIDNDFTIRYITEIVSSISFCIESLQTHLKNSVPLTNNIGGFIISLDSSLQDFTSKLISSAKKAV